MKQETRGMLLMLTCAILWSLAGMLMRLIPWNAIAISGIRSMLAALVVFAYMRFQNIRICWNRRSLLLAVCIVMIYVCYLPAIKLTSAAAAIVLQYTAPVYVLLFSALFLKNKLRRGDVLAVACTVAGIALFFLDQLGGAKLAGNLLALASGIFLGSMFFIVNDITEQERFSGLLVAQFVSAAIGIPMLITTQTPVSASILLYLAVFGIVQLGISNILYMHAARYCSSLSCSLISVAEPILNPIWVFLIVGERLSIFALLGVAVVLCAVTIWTIWDAKTQQKRTNAQIGVDAGADNA